jgi:hypothetical protein
MNKAKLLVDDSFDLNYIFTGKGLSDDYVKKSTPAPDGIKRTVLRKPTNTITIESIQKLETGIKIVNK